MCVRVCKCNFTPCIIQDGNASNWTCLWPTIWAAALPVAACQGSVLLSARRWRWLRMTGSPMPFHLQLISETRTPQLRQFRRGRRDYVPADLQLVHALCDRAVTRFEHRGKQFGLILLWRDFTLFKNVNIFLNVFNWVDGIITLHFLGKFPGNFSRQTRENAADKFCM